MLVISRKIGESVLIGDNVEVTIVQVDNGNVRIAIKAPKEIVILRKELYAEVENENLNAVSNDNKMIKSIKIK